MHNVSSNAPAGCGIQTMIDHFPGTKVCQENISHLITPAAAAVAAVAWTVDIGRVGPWIHSVDAKL